MSLRTPLLRLLIALWLIGAACPAVRAESVVLLHSTDAATRWTSALTSGLESGLGAAHQILPVFLGNASHDDDHFHARFMELKDSMGATTPAAVVCDGEVAFAFMRKYREDIFELAPVIYTGMSRPRPELLRQCGDCTGIPLVPDVKGTVNLIFRLRPDTEIVIAIMEDTATGWSLRKATEAAMEPYLDRASLLFPGHEPGDDLGLDLEQLEAVASSVPPRGAVLYLGLGRDNAGNNVSEDQVVRILAGKSGGPVFALSGQWMGTGILGGVMVDPQRLGRDIAEVVLRFHLGEPAREMLIEPSPQQPEADLTVMARFAVATDRLPAGTLASNPPSTPQPASGALPTGLVAVVVLLVGVVIAWAVFRRSAARRGTGSGPRP